MTCGWEMGGRKIKRETEKEVLEEGGRERRKRISACGRRERGRIQQERGIRRSYSGKRERGGE